MLSVRIISITISTRLMIYPAVFNIKTAIEITITCLYR